MLVKFNCFTQRFFMFLKQTCLFVFFFLYFFLYTFNYSSWVYPFMHMQTHSRHFKTCVFCFASPLQLRVKMWIVNVFFFFCTPLSVCASTNPTGGLFNRCLSLCLYCSLGFVTDFGVLDFLLSIFAMTGIIMVMMD